MTPNDIDGVKIIPIKTQTQPNYSAEISVDLKFRLRISRNRRFGSSLAEPELLLENSALTEFLAEF